jgi:hypothetical protein
LSVWDHIKAEAAFVSRTVDWLLPLPKTQTGGDVTAKAVNGSKDAAEPTPPHAPPPAPQYLDGPSPRMPLLKMPDGTRPPMPASMPRLCADLGLARCVTRAGEPLFEKLSASAAEPLDFLPPAMRAHVSACEQNRQTAKLYAPAFRSELLALEEACWDEAPFNRPGKPRLSAIEMVEGAAEAHLASHESRLVSCELSAGSGYALNVLQTPPNPTALSTGLERAAAYLSLHPSLQMPDEPAAWMSRLREIRWPLSAWAKAPPTVAAPDLTYDRGRSLTQFSTSSAHNTLPLESVPLPCVIQPGTKPADRCRPTPMYEDVRRAFEAWRHSAETDSAMQTYAADIGFVQDLLSDVDPGDPESFAEFARALNERGSHMHPYKTAASLAVIVGLPFPWLSDVVDPDTPALSEHRIRHRAEDSWLRAYIAQYRDDEESHRRQEATRAEAREVDRLSAALERNPDDEALLERAREAESRLEDAKHAFDARELERRNPLQARANEVSDALAVCSRVDGRDCEALERQRTDLDKRVAMATTALVQEEAHENRALLDCLLGPDDPEAEAEVP